tara:strand:+ start:78 stop:341 length:264 start_codon:yes stop_codon:yes gene_type:complete
MNNTSINNTSINNTLINKCLEILKREEIKKDIKSITKPLIELVLEQTALYIYIFLTFTFINFILLLAIIYILLNKRKKYNMYNSKID